jgi:hypothetical protein
MSADLPGAAHGGVDQRVCPAAIGGALSHRDELSGLRRQQRQGDRADAFDLDQRNMQGALASRKEVARRLHGLQDGGQAALIESMIGSLKADSVPGVARVAPGRRYRIRWSEAPEPFATALCRAGRACRASRQQLQSNRHQRSDGGTYGQERHRC